MDLVALVEFFLLVFFEMREGGFLDEFSPEEFLGLTPLHYALILENVEIIKLLLNAGTRNGLNFKTN